MSMTVRRAFSLDEKADRDILDCLDSATNASEFIRKAIRQAMNEERVSLATILEEIREIKRNGIVVGNGEVKGEEPEDIAASLDALGL